MTKQQLSGGEKRPGEQLRSFVGGGERSFDLSPERLSGAALSYVCTIKS